MTNVSSGDRNESKHEIVKVGVPLSKDVHALALKQFRAAMGKNESEQTGAFAEWLAGIITDAVGLKVPKHHFPVQQHMSGCR